MKHDVYVERVEEGTYVVREAPDRKALVLIELLDRVLYVEPSCMGGPAINCTASEDATELGIEVHSSTYTITVTGDYDSVTIRARGLITED